MKKLLFVCFFIVNLVMSASAADINRSFYKESALDMSGVGAGDKVVLQVVKTDADNFEKEQIIALHQFKNSDELGQFTVDLPLDLDEGRYLLRANDSFGGAASEKELVVSNGWIASSIEIEDKYGNSLSEGIIGEETVAKVCAYNRSDSQKELTFVGAYYDKSGKLVDIDFKSIEFPGKGNKQYEMSHTPSGDMPAYYKAMLIEPNSLMPCIKFSALNIRQNNDVVYYYVSETGSENGTGSIENPYATIQQAVDAAAEYHNGGADETAVIYLRGGHYAPASLDADDKNLIITSYHNENVYIGADKHLAAEKFKKVTEVATDEILSRVPEESRAYVYEFDLADADIEWDGTVPVMPYGNTSNLYTHLSINGEKGQIARYPNDGGFMSVSEVVDEKTSFICNDSRLEKWSQAPAALVMGAWKYRWAMGSQRVASVDASTKKITLAGELTHGIITTGQGGKFYIMNLLEELDRDGEWVSENGKIYVYSKNGVDDIRIMDGSETFSLNRSRNVRIVDLTFQNFKSRAIKMTNCYDTEVEGCIIRNVSSEAVHIEGTFRCGVRNSEIYNIDRSGVTISAGDRDNLTNCNHYVVNCKIHDYSPDVQAVWGAVQVYYCGSYVAHNEIYDSPNMAIYIHGNQHTIEYNKISNVCYTQTDNGAIYAGADWLGCGNVIRYNHIDNVVGVGLGDFTAGIYLDDAFSYTQIYGNIFTNVDCALNIGGGRGNTFENNIIYGAAEHSVTSMQLTSRELYDPGFDALYEKLNQVDYKRAVWQRTYPEVQNLLEDEPQKPKYNVIENNVIYQHKPYDQHYHLHDDGRYELFNEVNTPKNNILFDEDIGFVNASGGNYALKSDSIVYNQIADFEEIPFEDIGNY